MKEIYPNTMASSRGKILLFTTAFLLLFAPLAKSQCTKAFTYTVSPSLTVNFTSTAVDTTLTHFWMFHDHTVSSLRNPVKSYASFGPGTYSVHHLVYGSQCQDSGTVTINIPAPPCKPNFTFTVDSTKLGHFSMTSPTPADTSSIWFIVPGGIRYGTNPTYQFPQNGTYMVCLRKPNCSDTTCKLVTVPAVQPPPCTANFSYTTNSSSRNVTFTNSSAPGAQGTYYWNFGDGYTSSLRNPSHTYASNGTYFVCLTSSNSTCTDTICKQVVVSASTPCSASFTYTQDSFNNVYFNNTSTPAQAYYSWSFDGQGGTTVKNPMYQFGTPGLHYVCLTVRTLDSSCTSTFCDTIFITNPNDTGGCVASFSFYTDSITGLVHFTNTSPNTDSNTTFVWTFGDGDTSFFEHPTHQYAQTGVYYVCLYISDGRGCSTSYCSWLNYQGNDTTTGCMARFTYTMYPDSISGMNRIGVFQSQSIGQSLTHTWFFVGDSQTILTGPSQFYYFPSTRRYLVCLMITDSLNQCNDSTCVFIDILPDTINSGLNEQQLLDNSNVYPVPVGNELWVDVAGTTDYQVVVLNTLGKEIYQTSSMSVAGKTERRLMIKTSEWEQGVYLIMISNKHGSTIKRVIK